MTTYQEKCLFVIERINKHYNRKFELIISKPDSKYRISIMEGNKLFGVTYFTAFRECYDALRLGEEMFGVK